LLVPSPAAAAVSRQPRKHPASSCADLTAWWDHYCRQHQHHQQHQQQHQHRRQQQHYHYHYHQQQQQLQPALLPQPLLQPQPQLLRPLSTQGWRVQAALLLPCLHPPLLLLLPLLVLLLPLLVLLLLLIPLLLQQQQGCLHPGQPVRFHKSQRPGG
jgi:hypothetical protein